MAPIPPAEFYDDLAIVLYVVMFLTVTLGALLSVAIGAMCDRYKANNRRPV